MRIALSFNLALEVLKKQHFENHIFGFYTKISNFRLGITINASKSDKELILKIQTLKWFNWYIVTRVFCLYLFRKNDTRGTMHMGPDKDTFDRKQIFDRVLLYHLFWVLRNFIVGFLTKQLSLYRSFSELLQINYLWLTNETLSKLVDFHFKFDWILSLIFIFVEIIYWNLKNLTLFW